MHGANGKEAGKAEGKEGAHQKRYVYSPTHPRPCRLIYHVHTRAYACIHEGWHIQVKASTMRKARDIPSGTADTRCDSRSSLGEKMKWAKKLSGAAV